MINDLEQISIKDSDKLFIFSQRGGGFYKKLYVLFAHSLSKKGYPSIFLFKDYFLTQYIPKDLDFLSDLLRKNLSFKESSISSHFPNLCIKGKKISNSLIQEIPKVKITNGLNRKREYDWQINLKEGIISTQNINFFDIINNSLRAVFKRYNINYSNEEIISVTKKMVDSCDLLVDYFLMLKKFSKDNDIKLRIVGWESDYLPNSVFRILCDFFSIKRDIEYIGLQRGYNEYFNFYPRECNVIACNLTKSSKKNRFVVTKKELEFLARNQSEIKTYSEIKNFIKKPTEYKNLSMKQKNFLNVIKKNKSKEKNIFCLFTHLFYDTPLNDSSSSFEDMSKWIKETINFFNENNDILLLKPHPVEVRPKYPSKEPNETLKNFIEENNILLNKNIFLLHPRLFTLNNIIHFIDCGLIWRSSVALELPFYDIPSIIAGAPRYKSLNLNYPSNKEEYFEMIKDVNNLKVANDLKINCARYLLKLKNKQKYIDIISYDKKIKKNYFEKKLLNNYIEFGDKNVDLVLRTLIK